ncbi:MAG: hypothetical protein ACRC0L_10965 [Angustibacter sp.]
MNPSATTRDDRYGNVLADLEQVLLMGRVSGPMISVSVNVPLAEVIDADAFASGRSGARSGWVITAEDETRAYVTAAAPSARGRWVSDAQAPGQELWVEDESAPVPPLYDGPIIDGEILDETPEVAPDEMPEPVVRAAQRAA